MNRVILLGRLVRDPELKRTPANVPVATFSVATHRRVKKDSGLPDSDFHECVAWREKAEFAAKHFRKGQPILVEGELQGRTYTDSKGIKRRAYEVICSNVDFVIGDRTDFIEPPPLPEPPPQPSDAPQVDAPASAAEAAPPSPQDDYDPDDLPI